MKIMILAFAIFGLHSNATAATLAERKKIAATKAALEEGNEKNHNANFKKQCGYSLPTSADDEMVIAYAADNTSVPAYCDVVRSVLAGLCADATAKEEIAKKVKQVSCKTSKSDANFKFVGTTFEIAVAPGTANIDDKLKKWFEMNL